MADESNLQFTGERIVPEANNCEPNFASRMYQEHIARYLFASQLTAGKSVLDVGCGVGYGSQRLAQLGAASVFALDLSADAICHAKAHYAHPKVTYRVDNAEDFAVDQLYDVAVCFELIEHVNNPTRVFKRILRALKPDGVLIMSTPRALQEKRTHFHTHEYTFGAFEDAILEHFGNAKMYVENNHFSSIVTDLTPKSLTRVECLKDQFEVSKADVFIAIATRSAATVLPPIEPVLVVNDDSYVSMLERDVQILHKAENDLLERVEHAERQHTQAIEHKDSEIERLVHEYNTMFARGEQAREEIFRQYEGARQLLDGSNATHAREVAALAERLDAAANELTQARSELTLTREQNVRLERELAGLAARRESDIRELSLERDAIKLSLSEAQSAAWREASAAEAAQIALQANVTNLDADLAALQTALAEERHNAARLAEQVAAQMRTVEEVTAATQTERERLVGECDRLREALSNEEALRQRAAEESKTAITQAMIERNSLQAERNVLQVQLDLLAMENTALSQRADALNEACEGLRADCATVSGYLSVASNERDGNRRELAILSGQIDDAIAARDSLSEERRELAARLEETMAQLEDLREANASLHVRLTDGDERRLAAFEFARTLNTEVSALRGGLDRMRREIMEALDAPSLERLAQPVLDHRHRDIVESMSRVFPGTEATSHLIRDPLTERVVHALVERHALRAERDQLATELRERREQVESLSRRCQELSSDCETVSGYLSYAAGERDALRGELEGAVTRLRDLAQSEEALRLRGDRTNADLAAATAELDRLRYEQAHLRQRAEMAEVTSREVEQVLAAVRHSASWRLSAPLRAVSMTLGRPTFRMKNLVRHMHVHGIRSAAKVVGDRMIGRRAPPPPKPREPAAPSKRNTAAPDPDAGDHPGVASPELRAGAEGRDFDVIMMIGCWEGESKRYRVYNVAEALQKEGFLVKVMDFSHCGEVLAERMTARTIVIFRSPFDEATGIQRVVDYAREKRIRLVFDIDDLVFEPDLIPTIQGVAELSPQGQEEYAWGVRMYRRMLLECDLVTVTTAPLKRAVEKLGKPAAIIPNCLNGSQISLAEALISSKVENARIRVGYFSGSRTHQRDFARVERALLEQMAARDDWDFFLVGYLELGPAWSPYLHRVQRWGFMPYLDMLRVLSECDINLAPLETGDTFCEAKSELKYFEAALVGIPTIASPTEPFAAAIESGRNGLLADSDAQWGHHLKALLDSPTLRREIGAAARVTALEKFGVKANATAAKTAYFAPVGAPVGPGPSGKHRPVHGAAPATTSSNGAHVHNGSAHATQAASNGSVKMANQRLKIDWVIPRLIIGGGGHRNILRAAYHLERFGHDVALHFTDSEDQAGQLSGLVRKHFYDFRGEARPYNGQFRNSDAIFATHWSTVEPAMRGGDFTREVMYFVQDFEPAFAPMGSEYVLAENTYRQGLYCITSGPWCEHVLKRDYNCEVDHFRFPVDGQIYKPRVRSKNNTNLVFFAKPEMPRRCFELGVWALSHFHKLRPDVEILMFGSPKARDHKIDFPANYVEVVPTLDGLANMYANADLGLAFSMTNPSLVPYEMMASGCPVVDLRRPGNEHNYDGRTDIAFLADPRPDHMAREIVSLLANPAELARRRDNGIEFAKTFPDELGMARRVEELILRRLS